MWNRKTTTTNIQHLYLHQSEGVQRDISFPRAFVLTNQQAGTVLEHPRVLLSTKLTIGLVAQRNCVMHLCGVV